MYLTKLLTMDWKDILANIKEELPEGASGNADAPKEKKTESKPKDTLHVLIEKKGRGGKTATIVEGFTIPDNEVAEIASELKKKIGVGGSARGGEILIQGDRREEVKKLLKEKGFKVKG